MKNLNKLNEAAHIILSVTQDIDNEINEAIFKRAPLIIHQRFCHELMELAKDKFGLVPQDDPEMMRVLDAISYLEECYPELKR